VIKRACKALTRTFDLRDVAFAVGLGLLVLGLSRISDTHALIGAGIVILYVALRR
jgi:hypothetical protein